MKSTSIFTAVAIIAATAGAALVPEVSNVSFSQPAGKRLVTIRYTLTGGPAIVTVDIRTNGVSIGAANFSNIEGDVNRKVEGDTEHVITWRPDRSWPNCRIAGGVDAVVSAWALDAPPDYLVAELDGSKKVRYYTCAEALPGISGLLVCADADSFASSEFPDGFREVRFSEDCDCVESYMLAGAKLERVVLSAGVSEVGQCAFAWNRSLRELVIEGDASRIAGWADDAFEDCPCEEEYLELRRKAQTE